MVLVAETIIVCVAGAGGVPESSPVVVFMLSQSGAL